jgi:hypothetical protein
VGSNAEETQRVLDAYEKKGSQLTEAEVKAAIAGNSVTSTPSSGGYYDASKGYYVGAEGMSDLQRTQSAIDYYRQNNMFDQLAAAQAYAQSKGYNIPLESDPNRYKLENGKVIDTQSGYYQLQQQLGRTPTAQDLSAWMQQEKARIAGQTNPNSGVIWNQYGEVIGNTGTGTGGYVDYSWQAANAIVDPNRVWNDEARKNSAYQRYLTSTPLTGTYKNYDTGVWEEAPKELQSRQIEFVDYKNLEKMAQEYIDNNPNTLFDVPSLVELWMNKYEDISNLPNYFKTYSKEFEHSGKEPTINPISPGVEFANEEVNVDANGNIVDGVLNTGIAGLNYNIMQNGININGNTYMQNMQNIIMQQELAYIEQQQALLAMERDRQIAELEMIYERQVAEGKLSVREAEEALEAEKKAIDQEYYLASQKLNIYAQNMGIANSQQMIGLMQGDTYRKQQLESEATDKYNKRVADIRDRINSLMNERDIGIANANAQYNSGVINAAAEARLNSSNQLFNLYQTEYQNQYARQIAIEQALLESQLRIQEMVKQGEITAQQAEVAWEREKERLAIQFGYDVSLANMNNAAAAARAAASRDSDDDFDLTLMREAMALGIDPDNLPEGAKNLLHAVTMVREQMEDEAAIRRAVLEHTIEEEIKKAKEAVAQGKPTKPTKSPLAIQGNYWDVKYKKEMEAYERQLKAYNEGKALLDKYGVKY